MRIAIDATPAACQQAGVGRHTRELLAALVALPGDDEYVLASAAPVDANERLLDQLPPGAWREARRLPLNPRMMTLAWQRVRAPLPVEALIGRFDVFHGPDFVLPPSRLPRVVTIHDLSFLSAPQHAEPSLTRYLRAAAPRALASATLIIAVSGTVAAEITEAYPYARDRIVAIPNGVRMPAARAKQAASGPPTVLAVGTIEPRKNLQATISAMRIVRQVFPEARLRIAGMIGWRADETVAAIRAAEASGIAELHQGPGDEELERLYQDATIVAYPSFYEGFGLPVLEAMARGIPVVTSDICALRETAGDAARFVDPDDSEALAAEIISLLSSATLRQDYRERGLRRAGQFSWDETARRTRRVYQMAAAERQQ